MSGGGKAMGALLAAAGILVLVGLGIELGMARPQLQEIRRLERQRDTLLQEQAAQRARVTEIEDMADALQVESLPDLRALGANDDPVVFIGRMVGASGLQRLAILVGESVTAGPLRSSPFTVRVMGDFGRMLAFVRMLEQAERPVTIDAFQLQMLESGRLEGRFDVTVHDPIGELAS
ncbi:MAG: hypothetical protein R6X25_05835 [Candidatus Krumholzibacteriia bacterium]